MQSNLEVVRHALDGFDGRSADELLRWATEDVELRSAIIGGAEANVYRGHDGIREWARERDETFPEIRFLIDDMRAVGDLVVVLGHIKARAAASGVEIDTPSGWVVSVRDSLIATIHGYLSHDDALRAAAAGLK